MSADEIKALAQQAFVDGMACHRAGLLDMEVRCKQYASVLLAYAAMIERTEKLNARLLKMLDKSNPEWSLDGHAEASMSQDFLNFIMKGETK